MAYLGRFQVGTTVALFAHCHIANSTPATPDDCPQFRVKASDDTYPAAALMTVLDKYGTTGLFWYPLFLDASFPTGQCRVTYSFNVGNFFGLEQDIFEVVPGGDADGTVTGMHYYARPHADFIVRSRETGTIARGRNPRV